MSASTKTLLRVLAGVSAVVFIAALYFNSPTYSNVQNIEFAIVKGESARAMAVKLEKNKLIRNRYFFILLTKITGNSHKLQKGLYLLNDNMSSLEVLDYISRGRIYTIKVTVPEGYCIRLLASLLVEKKLVQNTKEFTDYVFYNNELKKKFGFLPKKNLEGFLYPETYYFPKNTSVETIAMTMVRRFSNMIIAPYHYILKKSGKSLYDIVNMASLIEKEARMSVERPVIAQVFYKRLRISMKLFCDPTVAYAVNKLKGEKIYFKDLRFDSPYNTYLYPGLPPTPICNPGESSIKASLEPANSNYLYFVAKNDGSHYFSKTLSEHNAAVEKYQRNRNKKTTEQ